MEQCPVCTLFLHNGMSLESHLDTHPKDQVIKALCSLKAASKASTYGSRSSSPMHSNRSYSRSRSRTPAVDEIGARWGPTHGSEHDRYWRRTPSRTPNRTPSHTSRVLTVTPTNTPSLGIGDMAFDNVSGNTSGAPVPFFATSSYGIKSGKAPQMYTSNESVSEPDFEHQYDQPEELEIKYSSSAEYNATKNTSSSVFAYNPQSHSPSVKLQTLVPSTAKRNNDYVNMNIANDNSDFIIPKSNNIALVKTNIGSVQYITPSVKPIHVVLPSGSSFMQKPSPNSIIMTGSLPSPSTISSSSVGTPILSNQFSQLTSNTFTPNKTVVTQNSHLIYQEMVHNIEGKQFISGMPLLSSHSGVGNVAQTSSIYQNVMLVNPYGNASCIYTPQQVAPQTSVTATFNHNVSNVEKHNEKVNKQDSNKSLVIEIGPSLTPNLNSRVAPSRNNTDVINKLPKLSPKTTSSEDKDAAKIDNQAGMKKGLKILSNIKVEVPVQHHKSMLNTVVDLTEPTDTENLDPDYSCSPIIKDYSNKTGKESELDAMHTSTSNGESSLVANTFSVIKNVGNPPAYKDTNKIYTENKIADIESPDSCPVPDLICNEKTSISPCSELSENGDNAIDHPPSSPVRVIQVTKQGNQTEVNYKNTDSSSSKSFWHKGAKMSNIYMKKPKKVLQIKNLKFPVHSSRKKIDVKVNEFSQSSCSRISDAFKLTTPDISITEVDRRDIHNSTPPYLSKIDEEHAHKFGADVEGKPMDIEPVSSYSQSNNYQDLDIEVKDDEDANEVIITPDTSNEVITPDTGSLSDKQLEPIESLRPINVIAYGNMSDNFDDDSNHKELLDLEVASKSKQFVNMMNENYFGDNIYADYFTPDRVESFDAARESVSHAWAGQKGDERRDGYLWNENSQKEPYALPSFIHESYKIAENSTCTSYTLNAQGVLEGVDFVSGDPEMDGEGCEQDSKLDVLSESRSESETALDICANEKMPPRGELSGQESNGDMDTPWTGMYPEVAPSESYDLIARESWISDGSDMDSTEKPDELEEPIVTPLRYACALCSVRTMTLKELHTHRTLSHGSTSQSEPSIAYEKLSSAIKKEVKSDDMLPDTPDSKTGITSSIFEEQDLKDSKLESYTIVVKREPRKRRNYTCPTCKEDMGSDAVFREHLRIHPLECLTCGKCFYKRSNLNLHMRTHLGIKNFKCEVCGKRFSTKQKLQEHNNIHTGRMPVKCTHCEETFRRYSNMIQHRDRHHLHKKPKIRDYVCHCGEIFHSRAKLHWHKETHDGKPKACQYCTDKFIHAASLTRHIRRAHNKYYVPEGKKTVGMENVPCPVCRQVYLRSTLQTHLKTHSGKRPFLCVICNKYFSTKWNLKLHKWVHMSRSAKPYKCNLCKGAFIRQSEFISHMNAHKSVRPYTCNYCGCQFIRKYNCQRHVKEHEMAKKYVCKVPDCGKAFHRSYYLTEHMRVHSGARPFSCNICGKTSSNKSNHNKHVRIHHAREPVATEA